MTGKQAIARDAWEAGVKVAAAYPGTPRTEILETLATYPAVIMQETTDGAVEVAAVAPVASMQAIDNPDLGEIANVIRGKLKTVIDRL